MASNKTQLTVEIITDATRAAQGLNETADRFEGFAKKATAALAGAFAVDKLLEFGKAALSAASNLEQAVGGVNLVFGKSSDTITDWAQDTTDNFRVPAEAALKFAATMGNSLQQAGLSSDQAAAKTKDLAQVGADLASAFGGSTVDALDAVNAAISKGEWERLESFGVTIKASDISAEMTRIADSMGGLSSANEGAIRTQASINLLMKEAGPALGAAASESETFAAKQEALTEKFDALLAAVGGPLLDAFGGLLDILSDLLPVITPLLVGISGLVAGITDLPAPVLATATALAGWLILNSVVTAAGGFAAALVTMRVAVTGFLSSLGPIGWAILAIGALATAFSIMSDTGASDLEKVEEAYDSLKKAMSEGGLTAAKKELFDQASAGGFADALKNVGVEMSTYLEASIGVAGAMEELQSQTNAATEAIFDTGGAFEAIGASAKAAGINQLEFLNAVASGDLTRLTATMQTYADEQSRLSGSQQTGVDIMNEWNAATTDGVSSASALLNATTLAAQNQSALGQELTKAADEQRALGTATGDAAAATLDAAAAQEQLKTALADAQKVAASSAVSTTLTAAKTDAESASRAVDFLRESFEALDARLSNEGAVVEWARGFQDAIPKLTAARDAGLLNVDALRAWDVEALQVGDSNRALYDTLTKQAGAFPDLIGQTFAAAGGAANLAVATQAAQDAANKAYGEFVAMGQAAGLTGTESEALAAKLGVLNSTQISPKLFEVIAQDENARQTVAAIQAAQIGAKNFDITAGADGAYGTLDDVLTYVDASGATIQVDAATGQATGAVAAWTGATNSTTATTTTKTNPAPANSAVSGWQSATNNTTATATLAANPTPANATVNQTVTNVAGRPDAILSIGANTMPFQSALSGLIRDASIRQAIVTVTANTAPYMAAFNALPTTKTITQTVVAAPAAAPAAQSIYSVDPGARTLGAGPVAAPRATSAAPSSSVTINVTGALDADSVARQIRSLLLSRDRRAGGVLVL